MPAITRQRLWQMVKETASQWNQHNAPRLGAALAYYTLLSIAPLLILVIAICGLVFDKNTAERQLLGQVQHVASTSTVNVLRALLENAHHAGSGLVASIFAVVALLFGASGVFVELRDSLNTIWESAPSTSTSWRSIIWQRLISFGMVLALGFLLLISLLLSATLALLTKFFENYLPVRAAILGEVANFLVPLIAIAVLFALIYKFVPDVPIGWRDVGIGAAVTAILFQIGKALLALYLATAAVGSAYGAAGSLVAFVVWVYYSAQIFFFGAIFTHVYANTLGTHSSLPRQARRFPKPPGQGHTLSEDASLR
ncbi:MAG TPA: YihY/virulence factor BrkB family protein [Bryobacteraceae bacterium]|jgi:membrane protein